MSLKLFYLFLILVFSLHCSSQERIVLNNNAFVVVNGNASIVLDNSNPNALTVVGSGGNIVSEGEKNIIKWNIGNTTGTYSIPWTNSNGVKIPLLVNVNSAGSIGGSLMFSTYGTNNTNSTWPSVSPSVNDMCSFTVADDASLYAIDRFWRIDANSYGSKPSVTMSFSYDFLNEAGGTNIINENNLQAQRYNPTIGSGNNFCFSAPGTGSGTGTWEGLLFGSVNTTTDKVNSGIISPANFFKDWILVNNIAPLPVVLSSFSASCDAKGVYVEWTTQSEINNDYFILEKSYNAVDFIEINKTEGNGNSNITRNYKAYDSESNRSVVYFRLKQVDFDGKITYHKVISVNCKTINFNVNNIILNNELSFNLYSEMNEYINVYLYDSSGKKVFSKQENINNNEGINFSSDYLNIKSGIYMLSIIGEKNTFFTKIMKK